MTSVPDNSVWYLLLTRPACILNWQHPNPRPPPIQQTPLAEKISCVWNEQGGSGSFTPVKSAMPFGSRFVRTPFALPARQYLSEEESSTLEFPESHLTAWLTGNPMHPGAETCSFELCLGFSVCWCQGQGKKLRRPKSDSHLKGLEVFLFLYL